MIEYLRAPETGKRDWHNYDYLERPAGLTWPWPKPYEPGVLKRVQRLLTRIAGPVSTTPPEYPEDLARRRI